MTRVKISAGILCLLVGISIFSGIWVNNRCGLMLDGVRQLEELAESNNTAQASELAAELSFQWDDFSSLAAILVKYDRLAEIGTLFSKIDYLVESESPDLIEELSELEHLLELLCRSETPVLTSVL